MKQAAIIPMATSRAQGGCPSSASGSGVACTKQTALVQTPMAMLVAAKSRLNAQVGVVLCSSAGPCALVHLMGQVTTEAHTLVWSTAVIPVSGCFTDPAACAGEDSGEGAKGEAESSDPGFAPDRLGDEASGLVAAAGNECGPLSFAPQTRVTTDHGEQAIGTLQVGERVLAYNPKTHKMELEPILHVWINHDHDLVDLTITTTQGQQGKALTKTSEVIHTNQKHPFFTMEHGFLPVGKIKLGMHILRADGRVGVVTGWKVVPGTQVMYNLEVAQDHTFTVGAGQWVVHNCASGPVNSKGDPYPKMTDPRTGQDVPFPSGPLTKVDPADRVDWDGRYDRAAFIREWHNRGYPAPSGGWDLYDIHHILPREYGGDNDFSNLVPVERTYHNQVVTPWWNAYIP